MRIVRTFFGVTAVALGAAALAHCVSDQGGTEAIHVDGGQEDAAVGDATNTSADGASAQDGAAIADGGFTISLDPLHLTMDKGDSYPVTVNIVRAPGFTDAIQFAVATPSGITASTPAVTMGTKTMFDVGATAGASPSDVVLTFTATSGSITTSTQLGVRIGSVFELDAGFTIPAYTDHVLVKVWGAGGGGGFGSCGGPNLSAGGGIGGFSTATLYLPPGTTLASATGTGGPGATTDCTGGGGGGYSALLWPDGGVIIAAGGGGGGASPRADALAYAGGWGGDVSGIGGGVCGGAGGQASLGGQTGNCTVPGTNGSLFKGGDGPSPVGAGGVPGGGRGGTSSGGGGGGVYGGGGGAYQDGIGAGGGGGGSGYAPDGGQTQLGNKNFDADFIAGTGVPGDAGVSGGPGRIIVRLPKPH